MKDKKEDISAIGMGFASGIFYKNCVRFCPDFILSSSVLSKFGLNNSEFYSIFRII